MTQLTPLTYQLGHEPALVVDETCSAETLYDNAEARLEAARGMLETVASLEVATHLHRHDLANVAQAAQILAADASDLYRASHHGRFRPR
ncbi:hypothetical protein [Chromohalobacter canadensis]|uniref:Uncharacterized protein n=1 Tax=Chromohalobacter canadensis TaxID=141389 RepID=A0ABZ0Y9J7_9GAMM|nr:hypothetical protein [Chromohalobacter canadensis]MCK0767944.1 hypothetical protein [Chromohalobacter canadensis]WQH08513.1 hypothetical protein SR908_13650 [Chromohalobacter canadensis]